MLTYAIHPQFGIPTVIGIKLLQVWVGPVAQRLVRMNGGSQAAIGEKQIQ